MISAVNKTGTLAFFGLVCMMALGFPIDKETKVKQDQENSVIAEKLLREFDKNNDSRLSKRELTACITAVKKRLNEAIITGDEDTETRPPRIPSGRNGGIPQLPPPVIK